MVDGGAGGTRRRTVYRLRALTHPLQSLAAAVFVFGLVTSGRLSVGVLCGVTAELVLVFGLPRVRSFRRTVDEAVVRAASEAASRERARSLGRMSDAHRAELERIEGLVAASRAEVDPSTLVVAGHRDGLEDLLGVYAALAVVHHESTHAFPVRPGRVSDGASNDGVDAEAAEWGARCARVFDAREQVRKEASLERRRIEAQLATIVASVEWIYESSVVDRMVRAREGAELGLWTLDELPGRSLDGGSVRSSAALVSG